MATAKVVESDIEVRLTLSSAEARVLYDLLGEGVFGEPRKRFTTPIFEALYGIVRQLPRRQVGITGRIDLKEF